MDFCRGAVSVRLFPHLQQLAESTSATSISFAPKIIRSSHELRVGDVIGRSAADAGYATGTVASTRGSQKLEAGVAQQACEPWRKSAEL